jgi:triosephosphate isomerase (TIM)
MRKPVIAANWKMYKTPVQAQEFVRAFLPLVANHNRDEIILCPSATSLSVVVAGVSGSGIAVGAQNMHFADEGAYTGEISAEMLKALTVSHVILGHSERRRYFCESDEMVNKKVHAALRQGLTPIVCIGESLEERESGKTDEVLLRQVSRGLAGISPEQAEQIIIAYEPTWAIGTGRTATPEVAEESHVLVRSEVDRVCGHAVAEHMRILYGGSVKPENAAALLNQPEIDGALVGGASLDPHSFAAIVNYVSAPVAVPS